MSDSQHPHTKFDLKHQLIKHMKAHHFTAAELSRRSGVPKQVLSLWLAGVEPRKLSHLRRVAAVFGISIDELCYGPSSQSSAALPPFAEWIEGKFEGKLKRVVPGSNTGSSGQ